MTVIGKLSIVAMTLMLAACDVEIENKQSDGIESAAANPVAYVQLPVSQDCIIDYGGIDTPSAYKILKLSVSGGSLKVDIKRTDDKPGPSALIAAEYVNDDYVYKIIQTSSAELSKVEKISGGVRISGSVTLSIQTDMQWRQSARQPVSANLGTTVFDNVDCVFLRR